MTTFPLLLVFLLLNLEDILANSGDGLTLDDLLETNVTCAFSETCRQEASANPFLRDRSCACDPDCPEFGTCCIDAPHRDPAVTPMVDCRNVQLSFSEDGYSLVSRCPPEAGRDSPWRDPCERDWAGEESILGLAPVSSLETLVSYKNVFCFRCNEDDGAKFVAWDLRVRVDSADERKVSGDLSVTWDGGRWVAATGDGDVIDVSDWEFDVPASVHSPEWCKVVQVSECAHAWTDEETRRKCGAYTAVVYRNDLSTSFRNPHCALCNFEPLEGLRCGTGAQGAAAGAKKPFSFAHLLNIHREGMAGEGAKCEENQLWDPYARKCRRIACAIPGYVVRGGRCTRP